MIEKSTDEMEISSTSLDLLSQAASLLNSGSDPGVSDYGSGVVSSSPPQNLQTKAQKVRRQKSTRRESLASSSAMKIRAKKMQLSAGADWESSMDCYKNGKSQVSSSVDEYQSVPPPPPYPRSPSPPRNPVLPPYPNSYRGDPLSFPHKTSESVKDDSNNNNNVPLDMSKKSHQFRPSVITCASALQQCCRKEDGHQSPVTESVDKEELPQSYRREVLPSMCDPVIDEHFRRSLGKDYSEIFASNATPSVSVTVDDHFAKALGDTWLRLQQTKPIKDILPQKTTPSRPQVVEHSPGIITL